MNETTTQTFQKHLFFRLFSLKSWKSGGKFPEKWRLGGGAQLGARGLLNVLIV